MQPTADDIIAMGFSPEMFGHRDEGGLGITIKNLITEHGNILSGRVGATAYASIAEPTSTYVKRAIKCSVAAELCQMRINRIAQDIKQEDGTDAAKMRQQRKDYLAEAEAWTGQIETAAGSGNDFAFGTVTTNHFNEDDD